MSGRPRDGKVGHMPRYLLHHHHEPNECGVVFAAFRGFDSPLRHSARWLPAVPAAIRSGGRSTPASEANALALLPFYVAERTTAVPSARSQIP